MPIRSLLWFDCLAGGIAGIALLALSGVLAPALDLPRGLLVTNAVVNLAYGSFSYSLARQAEAPRRRVRALIVANFGWAGLCVVVAVFFASRGVWLGAAYLLGEGVFVGVLAAVELRVERALPRGQRG